MIQSGWPEWMQRQECSKSGTIALMIVGGTFKVSISAKNAVTTYLSTFSSVGGAALWLAIAADGTDFKFQDAPNGQ